MMKNIISPKSSDWQTGDLKAKLQALVLEHHPDVAELDIEEFQIRHAWALSRDRVKVRCELRLRSGQYHTTTRGVPFALPPGTRIVYRDWTIIIKPTWYGFGYQLLDENGDVAGESSKDVGEPAYAEENAQREVNRLITERLPAKAPGDYVQNRAPAAKPVAPETSEVDLEVLPASESADVAEFPAPYPGAQSDQLIVRKEARSVPLPALISDAGDQARWRFIEFFVATIRNRHTRRAYYNAVTQFFDWLGLGGVSSLAQITPSLVGAYIEQHPGEPPTVKQHLAAIRMLFDWLVVGQVLPTNPAAAVRGPKYVVKKGKTPVLTPDQARRLLDSIDAGELIGLRDRALIAVMVYSFARVGAATSMRVEDYFQSGKKWRFRLHEKGGKLHEVPAHHTAEEYIDAYLDAAGLWEEKKAPLFQSIRHGKATGNKLAQADVYRMIRRRALAADLGVDVCCHTWRATGITAYLLNGGALETAQAIANHESPRTTKLYDRTGDEITLDEVERIRI
jgi:site-specific recombinase XerD